MNRIFKFNYSIFIIVERPLEKKIDAHARTLELSIYISIDFLLVTLWDEIVFIGL